MLRDRLRARIATTWPGARFALGRHGASAPHIVNVTLPGVVGEDVVAALDLDGIAASTGSACAAGAAEPSHVLLAMGRSEREAKSALRLSLGWGSIGDRRRRHHAGAWRACCARITQPFRGGGMAGPRIVVAMSGGVDSSVAAALLVDQGFDVVGVSMQLSAAPAATVRAGQGCCSLEDFRDARRVANHLGIPYYVWNLQDAFRTRVTEIFTAEYLRGRTPNPCVLCNRDLKFDELWRRAGTLGAELVATGHYARIVERRRALAPAARARRAPRTSPTFSSA